MAHRRLAVLTSHLCPTLTSSSSSSPPPPLSPSLCHANDADSRPPSGGGACVFCSIVRGESPAFKLYEDDICVCILDSNPLTPGHSLIIPKSHFSSLEVTPPEIIAAMCSTVPFLGKAIMKATECDSFNLLVNSGAAAGQVVFHTHLHIIPRRRSDKLWSSERSFRRGPLKRCQETDTLAARIREHVPAPVAVGVSCETQESKLGENS